MYHGTAHVILGSGLTIAGATFCLHFTRLPYFQTLGIPLAIGMLVAVCRRADDGARVAHDLQPLRPVRPEAGRCKTRGWRTDRHRRGALAGADPGRRRSRWRWSACWRCRRTSRATTTAITCPTDIPANVGYAAADRHFPQARMNPEMLLVETDHDVRNSADMLVIDRIAKSDLPHSRHRQGAGHHPAARARRSSTRRSRS